MTGSIEINPLVSVELASVDWSSVRIVEGRDAAELPGDVTRLLTAASDEAAERAYWRLDNRVVVQGQLYDGARAVVPALMAGLAGPLAPSARRAVADLLVELSNGESAEPEVARGEADLGPKCRALIAEGIWLVYGLLLEPDALTREWALHIARAVDGDRHRSERILRWIASRDADARVRRAADELLRRGRGLRFERFAASKADAEEANADCALRLRELRSANLAGRTDIDALAPEFERLTFQVQDLREGDERRLQDLANQLEAMRFGEPPTPAETEDVLAAAQDLFDELAG